VCVSVYVSDMTSVCLKKRKKERNLEERKLITIRQERVRTRNEQMRNEMRNIKDDMDMGSITV
jgi:hypothetical protein